jgi:septum formation protein
LGIAFQTSPSEATEVQHDYLTAREVAQINAYRKARAVAKKHPDELVLAADTLVYLEEEIFGKPAGMQHAYTMLEQLQGRTHRVVTALCLMHLRERRQRLCTETTAVTFRPLEAPQIRQYLNRVNPLDKAGAYGIQEEGELLVESISGSYTNVMGLPVELLKKELEAWVGQAGAVP